MNDLVFIENNRAVTTSLIVAEKFEKRHDNIIRQIEKLAEISSPQNLGQLNISSTENRFAQHIQKSSYKDKIGKNNPMYLLDRDGLTFLVMGFTGRKADEWKWKYIDAFNQMENFINFRLNDKEHQKQTAKRLHEGLRKPTKKEHMKANTIANKAVSNMYGFPKMVKKGDMTEDMLKSRQQIYDDTVDLMVTADKFGLDISVSDAVYKQVDSGEYLEE